MLYDTRTRGTVRKHRVAVPDPRLLPGGGAGESPGASGLAAKQVAPEECKTIGAVAAKVVGGRRDILAGRCGIDAGSFDVVVVDVNRQRIAITVGQLVFSIAIDRDARRLENHARGIAGGRAEVTGENRLRR